MANYSFNDDIKIGEEGERDIIKYLESKGGKFLHDNKDNQYDFIMDFNGSHIKYEVKTDVFCAPIFDTGNIFIEFESRNKPSGIAVTKAKWYVTYFIFLKEIWFIESDRLRKLIKENNFTETQFSGDNDSNTKGYLINRKSIQDNFIIKHV